MFGEMKVFAKPNTKEWLICPVHLAPEGFVEMNEEPPLNGEGTHIADASGDWVVPSDNYTENYNENVRLVRKKKYLEVAPLEVQLEALMEFYQGNDVKIKELSTKFLEIREENPKI